MKQGAAAGAALRFLQAGSVPRRKNRLSARGFTWYHGLPGLPKGPAGGKVLLSFAGSRPAALCVQSFAWYHGLSSPPKALPAAKSCSLSQAPGLRPCEPKVSPGTTDCLVLTRPCRRQSSALFRRLPACGPVRPKFYDIPAPYPGSGDFLFDQASGGGVPAGTNCATTLYPLFFIESRRVAIPCFCCGPERASFCFGSKPTRRPSSGSPAAAPPPPVRGL